MKYIKLTQGKEAIVDDEDFDYLSQFKWTYIKDNNSGHAYRQVNHKSIYMHRVLMESKVGQIVDHINLNGLDNRRVNLRHVTARVNATNKGLQSNNTSGYSGIHWDKKNNKWMVRVKFFGKMVNLGRFLDINDAIKVRELGKQKYLYV